MTDDSEAAGEGNQKGPNRTLPLDIPARVFGKLVSQGERMKLQPDTRLGGCWMIRTEYVKKLLEGKLSEVYFTWVPDRPDWKPSSQRS